MLNDVMRLGTSARGMRIHLGREALPSPLIVFGAPHRMTRGAEAVDIPTVPWGSDHRGDAFIA